MFELALYEISIVFAFIAWGLVTAFYIWPDLRRRSLPEALRPILVLHSFRFLGLAFLIPGVVSPDLPAAFAAPAAYGDLIAAVWHYWRWRCCGADSGSLWSGFSMCGGPRTSSTRSMRAIASTSIPASSAPRISSGSSLCRFS